MQHCQCYMDYKKGKIMKKIKISIFIIISLSFVFFVNYSFFKKNKEDKVEKNINNEVLINHDTETDKKIEIDDIKNNVGVKGDNSIYDIATDVEGNKNLYIKEDKKFRTALAGMLLSRQPQEDEINKIIEKNAFTRNGIFINEKSRNKFLKLLNNYTENEYKIDEIGYLYIETNNSNKEFDAILRETINSNKLYIVDFSDKCYILDQISGEVAEYPYELMDPYQICQIYNCENQNLIFITTNKKNKLTEKDIFNEFIAIIKN